MIKFEQTIDKYEIILILHQKTHNNVCLYFKTLIPYSMLKTLIPKHVSQKVVLYHPRSELSFIIILTEVQLRHLYSSASSTYDGVGSQMVWVEKSYIDQNYRVKCVKL